MDTPPAVLTSDRMEVGERSGRGRGRFEKEHGEEGSGVGLIFRGCYGSCRGVPLRAPAARLLEARMVYPRRP